jgi:hypothetical protein
MQDSNLRPPAPKAGALPDCANIRLFIYYTTAIYNSKVKFGGTTWT